MSNHQKEAGIAEFVRPLQIRLKLAKERVPEKMEKIIDQIITDVEKTNGILNSREELDRELAGYLGKIEREIDPWIDHKPREKAFDLSKKDTITEVGESSNISYQENEEEPPNVKNNIDLFAYSIFDPVPSPSTYLKSLLIFPEDTKLKKRLVIYWWNVLFRWNTGNYDGLFSYLVDKKFLIPKYREHNKVIDHFTIEPIFHKWLISNRDRYLDVCSAKEEGGTWRLYRLERYLHYNMLLNVDQRYLNSKEIMDISIQQKHLWVVQLGSWRCTEIEVRNGVKETGPKEKKSNDHIEVNQTDFFMKLGKNVKYLSLRGISGIQELPESIGNLDLQILDLRACHNLEKLPQKPRSTLIKKLIRWAISKESSWFNSLRVLDISECYLLVHMPKWVCELSNLEVLKGFVVGSLGNKNQSCRLVDLSKLNKLRKLSIRIAMDILGPEVFGGFNSLDSLLVLTITWGANKYKQIPTYSLPKNLEKLDIRCYPEADALSKLKNPKEMKNLKRLYIRGGNLTKIPCDENWKVEILRLRFLKKLVYPTDWNEVRSSFKNLKYVEYEGCPKPENFPNKEGTSWRNEEGALATDD